MPTTGFSKINRYVTDRSEHAAGCVRKSASFNAKASVLWYGKLLKYTRTTLSKYGCNFRRLGLRLVCKKSSYDRAVVVVRFADKLVHFSRAQPIVDAG